MRFCFSNTVAFFVWPKAPPVFAKFAAGLVTKCSVQEKCWSRTCGFNWTRKRWSSEHHRQRPFVQSSTRPCIPSSRKYRIMRRSCCVLCLVDLFVKFCRQRLTAFRRPCRTTVRDPKRAPQKESQASGHGETIQSSGLKTSLSTVWSFATAHQTGHSILTGIWAIL